MPRQFKLLGSGLAIALIAIATSAFLITRAKVDSRLTEANSQTPTVRRMRNLSLQPEAFKMSRRLGSRFAPLRRAASALTGNLTTGTGQQLATIVRRQTDSGETVELGLGVRTLKWSEQDGVIALSGSSPTPAERLLVERLTFDSADQFILAQLRGASYHTVARSA